MAGFYVFGVPMGQSISKCDAKTNQFLEMFYIKDTGTKMKIFQRPNGEIFYVFLKYAEPGKNFADFNNRGGSHFGMAFVLNNQQITNTQKLYNLFQATYDKYVKNKIIQEFPNGNKKWLVDTVDDKTDSVATMLANGFMDLAKNNPELNINQDIKPLQPTQQNIKNR